MHDHFSGCCTAHAFIPKGDTRTVVLCLLHFQIVRVLSYLHHVCMHQSIAIWSYLNYYYSAAESGPTKGKGVPLNSLIYFYISTCSAGSKLFGNGVCLVCTRGQGSCFWWFPGFYLISNRF